MKLWMEIISESSLPAADWVILMIGEALKHHWISFCNEGCCGDKAIMIYDEHALILLTLGYIWVNIILSIIFLLVLYKHNVCSYICFMYTSYTALIFQLFIYCSMLQHTTGDPLLLPNARSFRLAPDWRGSQCRAIAFIEKKDTGWACTHCEGR